jgi:hypothetical protein
MTISTKGEIQVIFKLLGNIVILPMRCARIQWIQWSNNEGKLYQEGAKIKWTKKVSPKGPYPG